MKNLVVERQSSAIEKVLSHQDTLILSQEKRVEQLQKDFTNQKRFVEYPGKVKKSSKVYKDAVTELAATTALLNQARDSLNILYASKEQYTEL